ncbi:inositol-pentakisphosphate 2-kinase [Echria macrotheca]|uniref:Inositol-pentakisphosphate 2-kinase n=1 Tax=Echria macrotheca TaxID=438768 RepID=A0AAJ0B4P0_9PEZI|nr:inositol-pentakisphosphate 2-kinase [Echria macrotheca]
MEYRTLPPANRCRYEFVGEGAANIVFKIIVDQKDEGDDESTKFQGYLLRVPKAGTAAYPHEQLQEYWETVIRPLFPNENDLVQQALVRLGADETIDRLNDVLAKADDRRRKDFQGSRVAHVEVGMLVQDMDKQSPTDTTFEFKPKWLAQSPNAPPGTSIRCRNCARKAQQQHQKHSSSSSSPSPSDLFCPLNLVHPSSSPSSETITALLPPSSSSIPSPQIQALKTWLSTNTLLPRLQSLQTSLDKSGPLAAHLTPQVPDENLQLAMTLRDCSVFVRISTSTTTGGEYKVEARLADLDKKNWAAKLGYWRDTERDLVVGGFYEGLERPRVETRCLLEWERERVAN